MFLRFFCFCFSVNFDRTYKIYCNSKYVSFFYSFRAPFSNTAVLSSMKFFFNLKFKTYYLFETGYGFLGMGYSSIYYLTNLAASDGLLNCSASQGIRLMKNRTLEVLILSPAPMSRGINIFKTLLLILWNFII